MAVTATRRPAPKSLARSATPPAKAGSKAAKAGSKAIKGASTTAKGGTTPTRTRSKGSDAVRTRRAPPVPVAHRIRVEVDDRTVAMTMQALECRDAGHHWARVPQGADRRALLAAGGEAETVRACVRCASTKTETYSLPTFDYVDAPVYKWSEGYLIAKTLGGRGRLSRAEVRKAMFARENPDLVLVA